MMRLDELARRIGGDLEGDGSIDIGGMAPLEEAGAGQAAFLANPRYERYMADTRASAVIVSREFGAPTPAALIRCEDPYFAFRQAMVALYGFRSIPFVGVDRRAYVDQRATVAQDVVICQFATVCENAEIGPRTVLLPGVFVGPGACVGADCVLHPNVVIYDGCVVGDRVTIHANTVVGQDGFGYATHDGAHHKIPQVGRVEIGDDVEIGACCAIDRAALGATRIEAGTKLSNCVCIGHGTRVGKHNLMVAQSGIAGSTTVGDYCVLAGQAGVAGHLRIGDFVQVGAKAGVMDDIPANTKVLGAPATELYRAKRQLAAQMALPELRDQVKKLTREMETLRRELEELRSRGGEDADGDPDR